MPLSALPRLPTVHTSAHASFGTMRSPPPSTNNLQVLAAQLGQQKALPAVKFSLNGVQHVYNRCEKRIRSETPEGAGDHDRLVCFCGGWMGDGLLGYAGICWDVGPDPEDGFTRRSGSGRNHHLGRGGVGNLPARQAAAPGGRCRCDSWVGGCFGLGERIACMCGIWTGGPLTTRLPVPPVCRVLLAWKGSLVTVE